MKRTFPNLWFFLMASFLWLMGHPYSVWAADVAAVSSVVSTEASTEELPVQDVQQFATALSEVKSYYVKDVTDKKLFEDAIRGMLENLDPHSNYLDEEDYSALQASTSGAFGGLGIELTMEEGYVKVISAIDGTPAARAGIKSGDFIIKLNNKQIKGMSLDEAIGKMRGNPGTKIGLLILRKGANKPLKVTLVRETIKVQSVRSNLYDDHYGYIRISNFQEPTAKMLEEGIEQLNKASSRQLRGVVLDLRNNPGGLLDSAIAVADQFLDRKKLKYDGMLVYTEGRVPGSAMKARATRGDSLNGIPMVVLINGGSASAAEIVAGALQDQNRAIVMGTTSFGKGSVQTVLPLTEKTAVKLTTALYYTPSGRSIQAKGIEPDIKVDVTEIPGKTKTSADTAWLEDSIKEANLDGHLQVKNAKNSVITKTYTNDDIMHSDFQLYQALSLLKGLAVVNSNKQAVQLGAVHP